MQAWKSYLILIINKEISYAVLQTDKGAAGILPSFDFSIDENTPPGHYKQTK
jgi:hypothetical protein